MVDLPVEHDIEMYPIDYLRNVKKTLENQVELKKRKIDKIDAEIKRRPSVD